MSCHPQPDPADKRPTWWLEAPPSMFWTWLHDPVDLIPGMLGSKPSARDLVLGLIPDPSLPTSKVPRITNIREP